MWFMRERIRQWPLPLVFVYYAVTFGALSLIVDALFGWWGGAGWAVLAGILFGAIMTPIAWWERKRDTNP